jgi:hypothetical protein
MDYSIFYAIAITIVIVILVVYLWSRHINNELGPDEAQMDAGLSKQLTAAGWVIYTKTGCSACTQQLKVVSGVPTVPNASSVDGYKIVGYPTWHNKNTKQNIVGLQTSGQLHRLVNGGN